MKNLQTIVEKFSTTSFNKENFSVGGGLSDSGKFASNRHEDARNDTGKVTEGEATQMFKKATGLEIDKVKSIINFAIPNMEWHHAGKLPKQYGGGMKKTYFLNANQIIDLATNWENYVLGINEKKQLLIIAEKAKKAIELKRNKFIEKNATKFERITITSLPKNTYITEKEMNGKFGWFEATTRYNMTIYYSGFVFKNEKALEKYLQIR